MSEIEVKGMKEIQEKVKSGEWILYETDKSGKLCLDTPENFKAGMAKHIEGDKEVKPSELRGKEEMLNNQSRIWAKIVNLGKGDEKDNEKQFKRSKATLTSKYKPIPVLSGLRKDHKSCDDPNVGPPLRPVCRANNSPNSPLGNILSIILRGATQSLIDNGNCTECGSTEEVCEKLECVNKKLSDQDIRVQPDRKSKNKLIFIKGKVVIGSMDVKGLYPAIQWDRGTEEVFKGIKEGTIEVENLNINELKQYLSIQCSREELRQHNLDQFVPVKLSSTNLKLAAREGDQSKLFDYTHTIEPNEHQTRELFALGIKKATYQCLSNHFYTFSGKIMKQSKGGSIGSELTGELARMYMIRWDQKFLKKVKKLGFKVHMYLRYVDDTLIMCDSVAHGVKYDSRTNKLIWDQHTYELDQSNNTPHDLKTFQILKEIADSIDSDIQFEKDTPSMHPDNKLPCLDLKIWLVVDSPVPVVRHEFYKKPMSSKYLILSRSALSSSLKRSSLFQEGMRRLLNCSPGLEWEQNLEHLNQFSYSLMLSGYGQEYRYQLIKGICTKYDMILENVRNGSRVMYRQRQQIAADKLAKGGNLPSTWHLKTNNKHTLQLPITPNSELVSAVKTKLADVKGPDQGKTLVVEKGGVSLTSGISVSDPFKPLECRWKEDCLVDKEQDCMTEQVTYKIDCITCISSNNPPDSNNTPQIYIGQSGRSIHSRMSDHLRGVKNGKSDCPLYKHQLEKHQGSRDHSNFEMKIIEKFRKKHAKTVE